MNQQTRIANRQVWADRLERFKQADLTVAQFCAEEGISVPSFYQWRRKLNPIPSAPQHAATKFLPLQIPVRSASEPPTVLSINLPGDISVRLEVRSAQSESP